MGSSVSSFSGAVTSYKQGKETKATMYRQAGYYERAGKLALEKAEEERTQRSKELESFYGTQRARISSSGITQFEGSPQEVLKKNEAEGNLELARIRYWGEQQYETFYTMAREARKAGRLAKRAGDMGAISGAMGGTFGIVGSIIGGILGTSSYSGTGGGGAGGNTLQSWGSSILGR